MSGVIFREIPVMNMSFFHSITHLFAKMPKHGDGDFTRETSAVFVRRALQTDAEVMTVDATEGLGGSSSVAAADATEGLGGSSSASTGGGLTVNLTTEARPLHVGIHLPRGKFWMPLDTAEADWRRQTLLRLVSQALTPALKFYFTDALCAVWASTAM
jgi:hypothetical protein